MCHQCHFDVTSAAKLFWKIMVVVVFGPSLTQIKPEMFDRSLSRTLCCDRMRAEPLQRIHFTPKMLFILPFPTYWRHFPEKPCNLRAQNTIPERVSTKGTRVGARRGFFDFVALIRAWILLRETTRILSRKLTRISRGIFQPFFPSSKNPRHPKSQNPRQCWKPFCHGFLWVLDQASLLSDASISMPINRTRKLTISVLGTSSDTTLVDPLRLRVQSRSRTRLRIAASIAFLFRVCFKGF